MTQVLFSRPDTRRWQEVVLDGRPIGWVRRAAWLTGWSWRTPGQVRGRAGDKWAAVTALRSESTRVAAGQHSRDGACCGLRPGDI